MDRVGRNDPCPCGSGKKYKKCCAGKTGMQKYNTRVISSGSTTNDKVASLMGKKIPKPAQEEEKKNDEDEKKSE